jgi:hypothetical protein
VAWGEDTPGMQQQRIKELFKRTVMLSAAEASLPGK